MNYHYETIQEHSDATKLYKVCGKFPVKFKDFMKQILEQESSFRIEFRTYNTCYGGWLGNVLELKKNVIEDKDSWVWGERKPQNWFEEIADKNVMSCEANGGWGQMSYYCVFEK